MQRPLFVYGTLLQGQGAHGLLEGLPQYPAQTTGTLYHLPTGYPALTTEGTGTVHGAWLDPVPPRLLELLDHYEGVHEGLYRRIPIRVQGGSLSFEAWAWIMDQPEKRGGKVVRSGRWRRTRRR